MAEDDGFFPEVLNRNRKRLVKYLGFAGLVATGLFIWKTSPIIEAHINNPEAVGAELMVIGTSLYLSERAGRRRSRGSVIKVLAAAAVLTGGGLIWKTDNQGHRPEIDSETATTLVPGAGTGRGTTTTVEVPSTTDTTPVKIIGLPRIPACRDDLKAHPVLPNEGVEIKLKRNEGYSDADVQHTFNLMPGLRNVTLQAGQNVDFVCVG